METDDDTHFDDDPRSARRGSSKADARGAARRIVQALDWMGWPRVSWAGGVPAGPQIHLAGAGTLVTATDAVSAKLSGKPAGVYAVQLERVPAPPNATPEELLCRPTPRVQSLVRLEETLIATSLRNLLKADRLTERLADLVGDLIAWRSRIDAALNQARLAIDADGCGEDDRVGLITPKAIGIEIGRPEDLASDGLDAAALYEIVESEAVCVEVRRTAAARLGQLRVTRGRSITGRWGVWYACGQELAEWPVDVVCAAATAVGGPGALMTLVRGSPYLSGREVVPGVVEALLIRSVSQSAVDLLAGVGAMTRIGWRALPPVQSSEARAWVVAAGIAGARWGPPASDPAWNESADQWAEVCRRRLHDDVPRVRTAAAGLVTIAAIFPDAATRMLATRSLAGAGADALRAAGLLHIPDKQEKRTSARRRDGHDHGHFADVLRLIAHAAAEGAADDDVRQILRCGWDRAFASAVRTAPHRARSVARWLALLGEPKGDEIRQDVRLMRQGYDGQHWGRMLAETDERLLHRLFGFVDVDPPPGRSATEWIAAVLEFARPRVWGNPDQRLVSRRADRERFVLATPEVTRAVQKALRDGSTHRLMVDTWSDCAEAAWIWSSLGFTDTGQLFQALCDRLRQDREKLPSSILVEWGDPWLAALLPLSLGRADRAMTLLLGGCDLLDRDQVRIASAWRWLAQWPAVREHLSAAVVQTPTRTRVLRLLSRLGLCLRLPDLATLSLTVGESVTPPAADFQLPGDEPVDPELRSAAAMFVHLARLPALPKRMLEILQRRVRLRVELEALETRFGETTPPAIEKRMASLRQTLGDSQGLSQWIAKDLRKALQDGIDAARLQWLEDAVRRTIEGHVRRLAGTSPAPAAAPGDWENAVLLYFSIRSNRGILRRLLQHEARGDRAWISRHPANRAFADVMTARGISTDRWTGPFSQRFQTADGPVVAHVETDPLRVLQMGNYFDTCLSEGGVNSYSTVANACEINKRVVYVRDPDGRVLGRKLLVMTPAGRILGFRSYGAGPLNEWDQPGCSPWIKIVLDVFCRNLADRCGATLHPYPETSPVDDTEPAGGFGLFARWYHDGAEPFDACWIARDVEMIRRESRAGGEAAERLKTELLRPIPENGHPPLESWRMLLWLGDDAGALIDDLIAASDAGGEAAQSAITVLGFLGKFGVGAVAGSLTRFVPGGR